jgi:hypothetical protein
LLLLYQQLQNRRQFLYYLLYQDYQDHLGFLDYQQRLLLR